MSKEHELNKEWLKGNIPTQEPMEEKKHLHIVENNNPNHCIICGENLPQEPMEWESVIDKIISIVQDKNIPFHKNKFAEIEIIVKSQIKQAEERERERIVKEIESIEDVDKDSRAKIIYYINQNYE